MNAEPARSPMTIGDVLGLLRPEFPDITISKIRFLESEGLVEPERSPSGYRKFCDADVERLRFVLTAQRDHYLPLRVIRQRLEARDHGESAPAPAVRDSAACDSAVRAPERRRPRTLVAADTTAADPAVRLTRRQLLDGAGIDEALLTRLEEYGLVRRAGGHYDGDALNIARVAAALGEFGFEVRHLRAVKAAADRQVGLIEQMVAPQLRRRGSGAHEQAAETAREIAALSVRLHAALVSAGLRESLDP
ncbi:transcriptional regulator FtsR [Actinomadura madurae]|uniref:transcriptional regulator FtsR n=1 Tax=Actinomadura madurae TaxID=1993 RepID=UPI0020275DB4|nr:MerR family transcriptional regulator [Actinomadura madurae]MCP9947523.1 MerR family transcriptional regulator [Actinomadura madurae]MCP9976773.1 MerR family transcriptional regulator [Actinomadura madurae]MCQ0011741.1 MerR family transcriptional regulator [Actinomadura madurae]URM93190.1 MerR family transcriptional regulator [Actinomadura madurae]URN03914.1 MerR family transcriptional regulator [Actinomadura madurae]